MLDYTNELCANLEIVAICRVTEGQCGETVGIKWNVSLSCVKLFRFCMFHKIQFIISHITFDDLSNKFSFEKIIEKFLIYFKRATNSFKYISESLLYSNHRHVSAKYVDVFIAARENKAACNTEVGHMNERNLSMVTIFYMNKYLTFHIKKIRHSSIFAGPFQYR